MGSPGPSGPLSSSSLTIGGITFDIDADVPLLDEGDREYGPFMGAPAGAVTRVPVHVRCAPPPTVTGALVFDAQSWQARRLPSGELALYFGVSGTTPQVTARFDDALEQVHVTCAPHLLHEGRLPNPVRYPLDQLLMIHRLALEGGLVVHCCAVVVDTPRGPRAVVCAGVSGAGKTTLASQIAGAPGLQVLSDDRAVIRNQDGVDCAWGTPWPGTGGYVVNRGAPLAAVAFLNQAAQPGRVPLALRDAVLWLSRVASVPWYERDLGPRTFDGLAALCARVPTWRLDAVVDRRMVELVRELAG